jgi:inorganic pyrophosphatase/exopolyphosphatase
MLLGVIVSDTVLLTSPTTTERDRVAARHLERQLELDAKAFGRELLAERAFGKPIVEGAIELPGVVSRKKQVAPVLLAAAGATV